VDRLWFVFLLVPAGGESSNEKCGNAKMRKCYKMRKCEKMFENVKKRIYLGRWTFGPKTR